MKKLRFATNEDKDSFRRVWDKCFNDSDVFSTWLFDNRFFPEMSVCLEKDNKIVSYLDDKEAIIYNMMINESTGGNIDVENEKGDIVSFGINDISTSYSFDIDDNNNLSKVKINIGFRSNFEEVLTRDDITESDNLVKYEKLQEQKIKKQAESLIKKSQKLNLDIFSIGEKLNVKHPYKFRKIKNEFSKKYKDLKIEVKVQADIERTYDTYQIHK